MNKNCLNRKGMECNYSFTEVNSLRQKRNRRHFADDIFKCIFMNENVWIPIKISLKFLPKGPINNIPALVQIMAWRRPGDKPLSEPMMVNLPTHICVTRPQWVKSRVQTWSSQCLKMFQHIKMPSPNSPGFRETSAKASIKIKLILDLLWNGWPIEHSNLTK